MRLILTISLLICLSLPAVAQETTNPIATDNSAQQDADIAIRIREILGELGNYADVTVTVSEGVVTLRGTATSTTEATELGPLAARVEGVVAVKNQVVETRDIASRLSPAMDRFKERLAQLLAFLPLALIAAALAAIIVFAGFALARMKEPWDRLAPNAFIAELYRQLIRIAFVVVALVVALDVVNATALLSTILGAAGIIGLALGFAVRDTVENYIASVMLSIRQPFRPNDVVEINGDQGKVIRLTSRATILLSFDGNHIRIPNATVFKSRIINFSQNPERRFMFDIMIDRNVDLQEARELVESTVQGLPFVLRDPAALTWIDTLEAAGVNLQVIGWVNQNDTSLVLAKGEAIRQVKLALQAAGIGITNATQVIAMESPASTGKATTAAPVESTAVAAVSTTQEAALDKLISDERDAPALEDLLDDQSPQE